MQPVSFGHDTTLIAKDGTQHQISESAAPIHHGDENILGIVLVFNDVTEQKQAERALRRTQKMDALGHLTGGVAHDFNNLLGIIQGNLELVELTAELDDKTRERLTSIMKATKRGSTLTRQLLGFSRSHVTTVTPTDINQAIIELESLIERSLTPQINVEKNLATGLWVTKINLGDFEDNLLNLLINARDAMPDGGTLTIETTNRTLDKHYCTLNPEATPGDYVCLTISDTGEGITPEIMDQIFEPFFTTKPRGKGTGLGLAMVFGFVQRSGGHISANSKPGVGTSFSFYLPRTVEAPEQTDATSSQVPALPRGNETILVVDDEQAILDFVQETLASLGYRVMTASAGMQAMTALEGTPEIDMLISDIVMPGGMNGYQLAEQALELRPRLKILLSTGFSDDAISNHGLAHFQTNLINKPYTLFDLARRVRALLDER
ncbi:MAG: response regulator [Halieaceae bacterium]|nr:response regulator [Halieaceae bacterium]